MKKKLLFILLVVLAILIAIIVWENTEIKEGFLPEVLKFFASISAGLTTILGLAGLIGLFFDFRNLDKEKEDILRFLMSYMPFQHRFGAVVAGLSSVIPDCDRATKSDFTNNDNPNVNRIPTDPEFEKCKIGCKRIVEIDTIKSKKKKEVKTGVFCFFLPTIALIFLCLLLIVLSPTLNDFMIKIGLTSAVLLSYLSLIGAFVLIRTIFDFK